MDEWNMAYKFILLVYYTIPFYLNNLKKHHVYELTWKIWLINFLVSLFHIRTTIEVEYNQYFWEFLVFSLWMWFENTKITTFKVKWN